jgi:hypothetical protein
MVFDGSTSLVGDSHQPSCWLLVGADASDHVAGR